MAEALEACVPPPLPYSPSSSSLAVKGGIVVSTLLFLLLLLSRCLMVAELEVLQGNFLFLVLLLLLLVAAGWCLGEVRSTRFLKPILHNLHVINPPQHATSSTHLNMPPHQPVSTCHVINPPQHATSSTRLNMPRHQPTSTCHVISPPQHSTLSTCHLNTTPI